MRVCVHTPDRLAFGLTPAGKFMGVGVIVMVVPSLSVTLDDSQYQYLLETKRSEQSKSERLRELLNKGIDNDGK